MSAPLLELLDATVRFEVRVGDRRRRFTALDSVSLAVEPGESVGLVGESGSGKSTLARASLGLVPLESGLLRWHGVSPATLSAAELRRRRRRFQLVFQDPAGSLDPRWPLLASVREPLDVAGVTAPAVRDQRARAMLARVGLAGLEARYPHELSGGQCQRAAIARAMLDRPELVVCDEAVSALDMSVQRQVLELLAALREETRVAYLFISHNLAVVRRVCDRVVVLYLGRIVEMAPAAALFSKPRHPYTRALLDAVPTLDPARERRRVAARAAGELPSTLSPPPGCPYQTRCAQLQPRCRVEVPPLAPAGDGRLVACHRAPEWPDGLG
jgi:oligopeptide/dipeptide ABC transporter ATP-binding protein